MIRIEVPIGGEYDRDSLDSEKLQIIMAMENCGPMTAEEIGDEASLNMELRDLENWLMILKAGGILEEIPNGQEPSTWKIQPGCCLSVYFKKP